MSPVRLIRTAIPAAGLLALTSLGSLGAIGLSAGVARAASCQDLVAGLTQLLGTNPQQADCTDGKTEVLFFSDRNISSTGGAGTAGTRGVESSTVITQVSNVFGGQGPQFLEPLAPPPSDVGVLGAPLVAAFPDPSLASSDPTAFANQTTNWALSLAQRNLANALAVKDQAVAQAQSQH